MRPRTSLTLGGGACHRGLPALQSGPVTAAIGTLHWLQSADEAEVGALLAVPIPVPTIIVATGGTGAPAPTSGAAAFITLPFSAATILAAIDRVP